MNFRIGDREIGYGLPVYIIAEAANMHGGDIQRAKYMAREAKTAGCHAFKIQVWKTSNLINRRVDIDHYELMLNREVSEDFIWDLYSYCKSIEIDFLCTAHTLNELRFLTVNRLIPVIKIPSGEAGNKKYLWAAFSNAKMINVPIIMSTGLHGTIDSIKKDADICQANAILHCISRYPHKVFSFSFMCKLMQETNIPIGYSDHSGGIDGCIAAAGLGACIIEKHFMVNDPYYKLSETEEATYNDYPVSIGEDKLRDMVKPIKLMRPILTIEQPKKVLGQIEFSRSIYAKYQIKAGDRITSYNAHAIRPGGQELGPNFLTDEPNSTARVIIKKGSAIRRRDLKIDNVEA